MYPNAPTINDNVIFDNNSFSGAGQVVTLDVTGKCKSFDWQTATNSPTFTGLITDTLSVFGSFYLNAAMSYTSSGEVYFKTQNTDTINTFGQAIPNSLNFNGPGTFTLSSNLTTNGKVEFVRGTLELRTFNLTALIFNTDYVINRTLSSTSGNINLTGSGLVWNGSSSSFNFIPGTGAINFNYTGNNLVSFNPAGVTHNNVNFFSRNIKFLDGGNYNALGFQPAAEITLPQFKVQTFSTLTANGNCGAYITFKSDNQIPGGQAILNSIGGNISINYARLRDINALGAIFAANNSLDEGNNSSWIISLPTDIQNIYWIGGTGNWNNPANWSYFTGGGTSNCIPGPNNNVFFDNNSGFNADTVFVLKNGYCKNMNWSGVTNYPVLTGDSTTKIQITESINLAANLVADYEGIYEFNSALTDSVNLQGVTLNGNMQFLGGATWNLRNNLNSNKKVYLADGSFLTNEFNLNIDGFVASGLQTKVVDIINSNIILNGIDTVWSLNPTGLTFSSDTSTILINSTSNLYASFYGGGEAYNKLIVNSTNAEVYEANTFNYFEIKKGKTVSLESGVTQQVDSLVANGSCDSIITIQSTANISLPAKIEKTGYDTTSINYCLIKNVDAVVTLLESYTAQNSTLQNSTLNWDTLGGTIADVYYWIGNTGNWSNVNNWSLATGGLAASCLPTAIDTVIFDNNSFSGNNQIVTLNIDGQCAKMDWSGITFSPELAFQKDLNVGYEVVLHPNLLVTRNNQFSSLFMLTSGDAYLDAQGADMGINIIYTADSLNDTLYIVSKLDLGEEAFFIQSRGTLINQADTIIASTFNLFTNEPKYCDLGTGYLGLKYGWNSDGLTLTTLDAGTSHIEILGSQNEDYLYGNGFTFYDLTINYEGNFSSIFGSNTFNKVIVNPGVNLQLESTTTQLVSDSLIMLGNCRDSIFVSTTTGGSQATITPTGTNYVAECLNVSDIIATSTINTLFSSNISNNGPLWNFNTAQSTVSNFSVGSYQVCLGDSSYFTNSSTAYSLNPAHLTFTWDFGNGDSSAVINPVYAYPADGKYFMTLTSEYKNGCKDYSTDSVNVNDPQVNLFSSDPDSTICIGELVTFVTTVTGDTYQFLINNAPVTAMAAANNFATTTLNNNDTVRASMLLNGCPTLSDEFYVMTVNPRPTTGITVSSLTDTICNGDSIVFKGNGAINYQFIKNSNPLNFASINDSIKIGDLVSNDSIYVIGSYPLTGCKTLSDTHVFIVNQIPVISLVNDSGNNVICQGDNLSFTAFGADTYDFYINSTSQGGFSAASTFTTTLLNHTDTVTVIGDSLGCQSKGTPKFIISVNAIPVTTITPSVANSTICDGDNLIYILGGAGIYEIFINGSSQGAATGSTVYNSSSFNDNDKIYVRGETFGCEDLSDEDTITVKPLPVVTLTNTDTDTSICLNDTVIFTAGGATTYQFYINGAPATLINASNIYTTDSLQNGETITVKGYLNSCEDFSSDVFTFEVKPVPNINFITSTTVICEGTIASFIAVGGNTYEYFVNGVSQGAPTGSSNYNTDSLPVGNPLIEVKGYINGCGSNGNSTYNVQVKPLPTVLFTIIDDTICAGDSIKVIASGASTYQFYIDAAAQGGFTTDSTFSTSSITTGQVLTVKGKLNNCDKFSDSAYTVIVNPKPVITFISSDGDNIICENELVTLTATGALLYEFFIDDTVSLGQSASGVYNTDSIKNGQKIALLASSNGCEVASTNSFTYIVNPTPLVTMVTNDSDTTVCNGESISFTGAGTNLYDFQVNSSSVTGFLINSTYGSSSFNQGDVITLVGKSNYGCIDTSDNVFLVNVNTPPTILLTSSDIDGKLCTGDSVTFNATGGAFHEFFIDGISQGDSSVIDSITVLNVLNNQFVSVIGEANGGRQNGDTIFTFNVYTYPLITLTTQDSISNTCVGEALNFKGNGGLEYEFFVDGLLQGTKSIVDTFATNSLTNGQVVSVVGHNNVCPSNGDTAYTVVVNQYPVVNLTLLPAGPTVCYDDSITFTSTGAMNYQYYFNDIQGTSLSAINTYKTAQLETGDTIKVIGYNGKCASIFQKSTYNVTKLNLLLTSTNLGMFCDGDPITFSASGATQYQFSLNGAPQGGFSATATYSPSGASNGDVVSVLGQGSGCTQKGNDATVNILSIPVVTPPGTIKICDGSLVKLSSDLSYGNYWYEGSNQLVGENDSIYYAPTTGNYSVYLKQGGNGTIWSVGNNFNGQLGDSSTFNSILPVIANAVIDGVDIDGGLYHELIVKADGSVWAWGKNNYGQMGNGNFTDIISPYQVPLITAAQQISAGDNFSLILLNSGTAMAFGDNTFGQLGIGSNGIANFPTAVLTLSNITSISAGGKFGVALDNAGNIWTWGNNQYGQLGNGNFINTNTPAQIVLTNVVKISAGKTHVLALLNDGTVWGWGDNSFGQLGVAGVNFSNTPIKIGMYTNIIDISAGADHSLILDSKNRAYVFGENTYGQLGTSNNINYTTPQKINNKNFKEIKAGYYNSFAVNMDNTISAWGKNQYGQLGNEINISVNSPINIPKFSGASKFGLGEVSTSILMTSEKGCQSNIVNVTIDSVGDVIAVATNDTTLSTSAVGVSYQWYLNGNPIPLATGSAWVATTHATYRVEVTFSNGCTVSSNNVIVYPIGIKESNGNYIFNIYPNPTTNNFIINVFEKDGQPILNNSVFIFNLLGKSVAIYSNYNSGDNLNITDLEKGLYLIRIEIEGKTFVKRIIKQ